MGISSETAGSTVWPASLSGLYGMKTRAKTVSADGVFKLSGSYDGLGVMARTPRDLVLLLEAISKPETRPQIPFDDLASKPQGSWSDIAVGMVQSTWGVPPTSTPGVPSKWEVPSTVSFLRPRSGKYTFLV